MASSMEILLAQMKAKKASQVNGTAAASTVSPAQPIRADLMAKLDTVKEKPVDYIGETIESQPRKLDLTTEGQLIKDRIVKLQDALEKEIPDYAHILHTIHKALAKDDELTHLLSDDEVGVLIQAMKLRKNVVLVEEKKAKSAKKSLKDTTLSDIL